MHLYVTDKFMQAGHKLLISLCISYQELTRETKNL